MTDAKRIKKIIEARWKKTEHNKPPKSWHNSKTHAHHTKHAKHWSLTCTPYQTCKCWHRMPAIQKHADNTRGHGRGRHKHWQLNDNTPRNHRHPTPLLFSKLLYRAHLLLKCIAMQTLESAWPSFSPNWAEVTRLISDWLIFFSLSINQSNGGKK